MLLSSHPQEDTFHEHLLKYMLNVRNKPEQWDDIGDWNQLLHSFDSEKSPLNVVNAFADAFTKYPSYKLLLLQIMRAVVSSTELVGGYNYPEFFWIIVESGLFSEGHPMQDIMNLIAPLCDRSILRAYLTCVLATESEPKLKEIVMAFYHVGHTLESLKLLTDTIPLNQENEHLYTFIYSDAVGLLHSERLQSLGTQSADYLRTLFGRGLQSSQPHTIQTCQTGLKRLEFLTQFDPS